MQKYKVIIALIFPIIVLGVWIIFLTVKVLFMPEVRVHITGYDPRDLLSGHYISYTIDWESTDCSQFSEGICPVKKFAEHAIHYHESEQHRFYIPENYAEKLDKLFRLNNENHIFEVVYKYGYGMVPVARQLLVDGKSWQEMIKE